VGNPNSGKTTVFNHYTGARQHVANYPGVTVERKEGLLKWGHELVRVVDLPGTYALTAYSQDELVARRALTMEKPDCVIIVLNACALERNLYLAVQIMELGLPVVLALNMYDEAVEQGLEIDTGCLGEILGLPVFTAVARRGEGLREAMEAAVSLAQEARNGLVKPPLRIAYGPDLDPLLDELSALLERDNLAATALARYPLRWAAVKCLENDAEVISILQREAPTVAGSIKGRTQDLSRHLKATIGADAEAVVADYRYGFIASLLRGDILRRREDEHLRRHVSDRLDMVLTHQLLGPLILLGALYVMYKITFSLGAFPMLWLEKFFALLNGLASEILPEGLLRSLVVSGVIDGVGGVMSFVPLILIMFMLISVLEDSGYMARAAYMLDRVFRVFGLHGYSVMPFIVSGGIAGGCAVPGVMATRTLRSPREKLGTILTLPFMTCGAKLPVFLLLTAAFFPQDETAAMLGVSLFAWGMALLVAKCLRTTLIRGDASPFVMELPPYRMPTLLGVMIHSLERVWQYIKKAGTVILTISILIWAGMTFPALPEEQAALYAEKISRMESALAELGPEMETESAAPEKAAQRAPLADALHQAVNELNSLALAHSYAGRLGAALEPLTAPLGFDWRVNIALIGGLGAKEVIVSTLGTAYSLGELDTEDAAPLQDRIRRDPDWNPATAVALMVYVLLYSPCFATLVVLRQETGHWKWAAFSLIFNTALAFAVAALARALSLRLLEWNI
jgi:ferrous iron transport protein B